MTRLPTNCLIFATVLWGGAAQAQGDPAPADATTLTVEPPPPEGLSDEELARLAEGEAIEIFDERPDKPFDRDTEVRLTGEQLAARGATDLASALALIPEINIRDGGRGGFVADIRGGRKGAVAVLVDGVPVSDPFYGTFDVSTIPVTDIVQIRVSATPQSPIDGIGGPGGVIEVLTRDAIGEQLVIARVTADTLPSFGITGTARAPLAKKLALRLSASGLGGARDMELPTSATINENRRAASGAGRLEYRDRDRRIVLDGFLDDRSYLSPPAEEGNINLLLIDRETSARTQLKADDKIGKLQLQGTYFIHYLERRSRRFDDPSLMNEFSVENLQAIRSGGGVLATRPFLKDYRWIASVSAEHDKALVFDENNDFSRGDATLLNTAVGVQYARNKLRLDGAFGIAMPFGVGADAWPETKLVGKYRLTPTLELTATAGYKGRIPSLRERFDRRMGNASLGPERALHGELRAVEQRDRLRVEVAPFYRLSNGNIVGSPDPADMGMLVNLGDVDIYGIDTQARVLVHPNAEVGGSYNFIRAKTIDRPDALDRLPRHRFDAWAKGMVGPRYSALARVRYHGSSIDLGDRVPGYVLVEATLTAQLTKEYLAVLRVDDLLDARPETRAGYFQVGRVISVVLQGAWN